MISFHDFAFLTEAIKAKSNKAVIVFGRMNPPTKGHLKLLEKLKSLADENDAMALVYLSKSGPDKTPDKNPIPYEEKYELVKKYAPKGITVVDDSGVKTLFNAVENASKLGAKTVYLVAGSDRVEEFKRVQKYKDDYGLEAIEVVSSGDRDADSEDLTSSISGTKMRQYALDNDYDSFKKGSMTKSEEDTKKAFELVKKGLSMVKPKKPRASKKKA